MAVASYAAAAMSDDSLPGPHLSQLKSLGQLLKPVAHLGKGGLSDAFVASVDQALTLHELVKVKLEAHKDQKKALVPELATRTRSRLIQRVGNVAVLYRQHPDPEHRKIGLKDLRAPGDSRGPKAQPV